MRFEKDDYLYHNLEFELHSEFHKLKSCPTVLHVSLENNDDEEDDEEDDEDGEDDDDDDDDVDDDVDNDDDDVDDDDDDDDDDDEEPMVGDLLVVASGHRETLPLS